MAYGNSISISAANDLLSDFGVEFEHDQQSKVYRASRDGTAIAVGGTLKITFQTALKHICGGKEQCLSLIHI
jgi:hypothetical protein